MMMAKHYLQIIVIFVCFLAIPLSYSQNTQAKITMYGTIEGLTIYPNPVSNGKIYISSKKNLSKYVEIFDVLGKKVYATSLSGKMMDVSRLNIGVYIIKITENNNAVTRKLVVK